METENLKKIIKQREVARIDFKCEKTACNQYKNCNSAKIKDEDKNFIPTISAVVIQFSGHPFDANTQIGLYCKSYSDLTSEANHG